MEIEKFELFEKEIQKASNPEEFFGGDMTVFGLSSLKTAIDKRRSEFSTFVPADDNQEIRLRRISAIFALLETWAIQKMESGNYSNGAKYRLKLLFVVRHGGKNNRFHLLNSKSVFARKEISAGAFEGVLHFDQVSLIKEGVPTKRGWISEYGTHGAMNCFHYIYPGGPSPYLRANDFTIGDIIEIETWNYESIEEFLKRL